ncbi:MAG: hydantoinase B/oxoprolinase family protein, partial [Elusimicrobiota bacterium]|nr:hydantoinase B/oxoprolinase family protein [Elusimicrobiota bacterium]
IEDVYVRAKVTITDDEFIIDLTGSDPQVPAPINCTRYGALSAARIIYRPIISPHGVGSEGLYKPLKLIVPDGTVFSATRPAPVSCNWEALSHLTDLVAKALAPHIPERITAAHFLSIVGTILGGIDDKTRQPFVLCEPQAGGWGAGVNKDGESGLVAIGDGETFVMPAEVAETRYPIIVEQYSFNLSSGAGKFRGGYGLIRDYRLLNSTAELTSIASRYRYFPWGVNGGKEGSNNKVQVFSKDKMFEKATFSNYPLKKGDLVRYITGGGGGYGDPLERDPIMVLDDVLNEYITIEEAKKIYGVIIEESNGKLIINKDKANETSKKLKVNDSAN